MPLTRRPPVQRRGKAERRERLSLRYQALRSRYAMAVEFWGCELSYRQWLHSSQRKVQESNRRPVRPHRSGGGHATH